MEKKEQKLAHDRGGFNPTPRESSKPQSGPNPTDDPKRETRGEGHAPGSGRKPKDK